ncbi:MAG TPA: hypothetical protein RMH99_14410 [Sandaracinaceae bacterium LLY-WYZ-13_1]|nr:hypothetical protein [Sandaracinaceae bacterium LLY-WYZ-13_1]
MITYDSTLTWILLVSALGPAVAAVWTQPLMDRWPWAVLLAVGLGLAAALRPALRRVQAWVDRLSARATEGEVAPEHAPGRWWVWVALPAWTLAIGLVLDVQLDPSVPREHASQVVRIERGKAAWFHLRDPRGGTFSVRASDPMVRGLGVGDEVTLVVRDGLFGWPWLEAVRRTPTAGR